VPRCQKIRRSKRQVCVGDLDTEIILQDRAIQGVTTADVNFDETFTPTATVWAMIETVAGATVFDSTNTEVALTHRIYIRFDATVTAETWVEIYSDKYDIVTVENLDRRSEFMRLNCVIRGPESSKVNLS
jgi:SPP1 family predicted phage head-tail adaptor